MSCVLTYGETLPNLLTLKNYLRRKRNMHTWMHCTTFYLKSRVLIAESWSKRTGGVHIWIVGNAKVTSVGNASDFGLMGHILLKCHAKFEKLWNIQYLLRTFLSLTSKLHGLLLHWKPLNFTFLSFYSPFCLSTSSFYLLSFLRENYFKSFVY